MPFAKYDSFADCLKKVMDKTGWNKERAAAYCAVIKRKTEKK